MEPLISIIIPVYNGANYLSQAIDSALLQTYENIEIIVVNDGSDDDGATEKIALSYGDKIRYYYKENGGVSTALNLGIREMKGDYFSWLSHDDLYCKDKIKKQVEALKKINKKNVLIYCRVEMVDKNLIPMKNRNHSLLEENTLINGLQVTNFMLKNYMLNGCAFLIPKKVFEHCGGFDERLRFNQDAFLWYKIFTNDYYLYSIPYIGVKSRVHDKQLTHTGQKIFISDCNLISETLVSIFGEVSSKDNNLLLLFAKTMAKYGVKKAVVSSKKEGKQRNLFTIKDIMAINMRSVYSHIRPFLRKIYYKFIKNIKTS